MADLALEVIDGVVEDVTHDLFDAPVAPFPLELLDFEVTRPVLYIMRGRDSNCPGPAPTYRVWTSYNVPDYIGTFYDSTFCGVSKNIVEIALLEIVRI